MRIWVVLSAGRLSSGLTSKVKDASPLPLSYGSERVLVEGVTQDDLAPDVPKFTVQSLLPSLVNSKVPDCEAPGASVIEEGEIGAGDPIEPIARDPVGMTVAHMMRLLYFEPDNLEDARRALRIEAMSPGWRDSFEDRLLKAGAG